jgi:hypothetical protein
MKPLCPAAPKPSIPAAALAAALSLAPLSTHASNLIIEPDAQRVLDELAASLEKRARYSAVCRAYVVAYTDEGRLCLDDVYRTTIRRDGLRQLVNRDWASSRHPLENKSTSKEEKADPDPSLCFPSEDHDSIWQTYEGQPFARITAFQTEFKGWAELEARASVQYLDPIALKNRVCNESKAIAPEKYIEERFSDRVSPVAIRLASIDDEHAHLVVETMHDTPIELGALQLIRIPETSNWAIESLAFDMTQCTKPMTQYHNTFSGSGADFHPTKLTMTTLVNVPDVFIPSLRESLTIVVEDFDRNPVFPESSNENRGGKFGTPAPIPEDFPDDPWEELLEY